MTATPGARSRPAEAPTLVEPAPEIGVRLPVSSRLILIVSSVLGLAAFVWPLWIPVAPEAGQHAGDAPIIISALIPVIVLLVLAQLGEGGMTTRTLAMLGVLSAVNAALRPTLGAGTAGVESVFFLLVLAGRAFGPGFGYLLGCTSLFASALLTAGVGPWLPFQMLCAAWVGFGAGLLPRRVVGRGELALLIGYGIVSAYGFGLLMNLWFWPFITGISVPESGAAPGALDYVPGAPVIDNLRRFGWFTLITSTGGWDTGRAITTSIALALLGRPVLGVLRRAARR